MNSKQLDFWQAEMDALPWGGLAPRLLAQEVVHEKLKKFRGRTGGVDNSTVCCPSREAQCFDVDPAQLQLYISTSF